MPFMFICTCNLYEAYDMVDALSTFDSYHLPLLRSSHFALATAVARSIDSG